MMPTRKFIPYAWIAIVAVFLIRAPHPAASGAVDPDVYWHILYGHWILDHLALPASDMWSWTMPGKNYSLTQWLSLYSKASYGKVTALDQNSPSERKYSVGLTAKW